MKKTILNQSKSFFIVALALLLVMGVVVVLIPAVVPWETISKYHYSKNAGHEMLNAAAVVYCVIMVLPVFVGTVFNQIAIARQDRKAIRAFWFLIADAMLAGFGVYLFAYGKTAPSWLTSFVNGAFFLSYLFFVLWGLICFFLFFGAELAIKIKTSKGKAIHSSLQPE